MWSIYIPQYYVDVITYACCNRPADLPSFVSKGDQVCLMHVETVYPLLNRK